MTRNGTTKKALHNLGRANGSTSRPTEEQMDFDHRPNPVVLGTDLIEPPTLEEPDEHLSVERVGWLMFAGGAVLGAIVGRLI